MSYAAIFGIIALVIFAAISVAAIPQIFGSTAQDAIANNVSSNADHNSTYASGVAVTQGFYGFDIALVTMMFLVVVVVVLLYFIL